MSGARSAPGRGESSHPGSRPPQGADAIDTLRPVARAVLLVGPGWECTLPTGEYLIGRDSSCRVFIDDILSSRQHARLLIRFEGTTIEDRDSANGVFVNNVRISKPQRLFDGDRVLIGATEIGVFNGDVREPDAYCREESPTLTETPEATPGATLVTVRAGSLEVLGRVAERLLAAGDAQKARQVLLDQLVKILDAARSGIPIQRELCWTASHYALKLARALGEGVWIDYTMEVHLRGEHPMAPEILDDLLTALPRVGAVDRDGFSRYVNWLKQSGSRRSGHSQAVAERLLGVKLP